MAQEIINGITFDNENVTSRNDSLIWHYHYLRSDLEYANLNYGILAGYNDGLAVLTSGLEMTVRAGIAVAYGRHCEVELPTILNVASGEIGKLVIDIDLNQDVNQQVSLLTTTDTLIQENLSGTGLRFQIPLGTYDSTSGNVVFTRDTNDLNLSYIDDELDTQFVHLEGNEEVKGVKSFTNNTEFNGQILNFSELSSPLRLKGASDGMSRDGILDTFRTNGLVSGRVRWDRTTSTAWKSYLLMYNSQGDIKNGLRMGTNVATYDYGKGATIAYVSTNLANQVQLLENQIMLQEQIDAMNNTTRSTTSSDNLQSLYNQYESALEEYESQIYVDERIMIESNIDSINEALKYESKLKRADNVKELKDSLQRWENALKQFEEERGI